MNIPQWIVLFLIGFKLVEHICKNGQTKELEYNGCLMFVASAIEIALLAWGGFWDCWLK